MRRSSIGSPLHASYVPPDIHDDDTFNIPADEEDIEMDAEMDDSVHRGKSSKQQATGRRANSLNRAHSVSDHDDVPKAQPKGKARRVTQDEDDDVAEEIAQGLSDVEMQQDEDEVVEPPPKKPPKEKKPRTKRPLPEAPCKSIPTATANLSALLPAVSPENATGLRRGKRLRYEPLEWWRCEKVVYGRRDPGKITYVPTIKEIVRIPKDPPKPLGATHRSKRHAAPRIKSEVVVTADNPEEGWDDKTPTNGVVVDWFTGNEVSRRKSSISAHSQTDFFPLFCLTYFPQVLHSQSAW